MVKISDDGYKWVQVEVRGRTLVVVLSVGGWEWHNA